MIRFLHELYIASLSFHFLGIEIVHSLPYVNTMNFIFCFGDVSSSMRRYHY